MTRGFPRIKEMRGHRPRLQETRHCLDRLLYQEGNGQPDIYSQLHRPSHRRRKWHTAPAVDASLPLKLRLEANALYTWISIRFSIACVFISAIVQELANGQTVSRYGFIHALYQNVLYDRLSAFRPAQLHQ